MTLITGTNALPVAPGIRVIHTTTASAMHEAVLDQLPADIFVGAAAVADWRMNHVANQKIKKHGTITKLTLELVPTADILHAVATHKHRPALVVGFAAETENLGEHAQAKRTAKQCDWIVANDVSQGTFGHEENEVMLVTEEGVQAWPRMLKAQVAEMLVERIATHFARPQAKKKHVS